MDETVIFMCRWMRQYCLCADGWDSTVYVQMDETVMFMCRWMRQYCLYADGWDSTVYMRMDEIVFSHSSAHKQPISSTQTRDPPRDSLQLLLLLLLLLLVVVVVTLLLLLIIIIWIIIMACYGANSATRHPCVLHNVGHFIQLSKFQCIGRVILSIQKSVTISYFMNAYTSLSFSFIEMIMSGIRGLSKNYTILYTKLPSWLQW
jgi:hypothetical protein